MGLQSSAFLTSAKARFKKTLTLKKACINRPFFCCEAFLHWCRTKAFEEKPIISRWVIVACVRKSYLVGVSDPSRPDFPHMGVSVFSNSYFLYAHRRGQPAISLIPNCKAKINKIPASFRHFIKIFIFASNTAFFGSLAAFSEVKLQHKNQNLAPAIPCLMPLTKPCFSAALLPLFRFDYLVRRLVTIG